MTTSARIIVQDKGHGPLELREVTLPDPGPHEVLIRMHASAVCQSQLFWMNFDHPTPMLFGHEGYGTVVAAGSAVSHVTEGDAVLVTLLPRQSDRAPIRASIELPGGTTAYSPNVYTWGDHALADELYVVALPSNAHSDVVSILGCAVITGAGAVCNAAPVPPGGTVAVFGVGGVGLSAVAAAAVRGASRIVAVDLDADKLAFARRFGATDTIDASSNEDIATKIQKLTGGVDVAVDCVGLQTTTTQALDSLRAGRIGYGRGGTAVIIGLPQGPMTLNVGSMLGGQKQLVGTTAGGCTHDDLDTFLDWYTQGRLDLDALVTDRYPLEDVSTAVADLAAHKILGRALVTM